MGDDALAGLYQVNGKYRDRVEISGPYDDPQKRGFAEGVFVYSVTYMEGHAKKVTWHEYLPLTAKDIKTRGWRKITKDDPATW
jgi:hypothetical protein